MNNMYVIEKEIRIPKNLIKRNLIESFSQATNKRLTDKEIPIRFVVTKSDASEYNCEMGVLANTGKYAIPENRNIFCFNRRKYVTTGGFNAVLIIPTGIGAELGGHSGDGGPISRLIASACDNLITHPNVVNAADINELPENGLYVEGSVICRLLMGTVALQKVRSNKVLLMLDEHPEDKLFHELSINSVSAARAALGLNCPRVVKMDKKIEMRALFAQSGRAVGRIDNLELLCDILSTYNNEYDAIALSSLIKVPEHFHKEYFDDDDMINPWGGVEAMLTHTISIIFNMPSAHSPMMSSREVLNMDVGIVDPRKSAEAVSTTYLHCILKGLLKSPKIINDSSIFNAKGILSVNDISCLIIPDNCIGLPTLAALEQGIPIIAVKENKNRMKNDLMELPFEKDNLFIVENYLEAVGIMASLKSGVALEIVKRPISYTKVTEFSQEKSNINGSNLENIA